MNDSKNGLDAFEQRMKDTLDQFEVPYNSADWVEMEHTLIGGSKGWWLNGAGLMALLLGGMLAIGGTTWYMMHDKAIARSSSPDPSHTVAAAKDTDGDAAHQTRITADPTPRPNVELNNAGPTTSAPDEKIALQPSSSSVNPTTSQAKERPTMSAADQRKSLDGIKTNDATTNGNHPLPVLDPMKPAATPNSEMTFKASVSTGCPGTSVDFKVENMPEKGIYLWNFGDGSFSNKPNPEHTFTKPGQYQVMLSMSALGVGTIHNKPSSDKIVIHEAPKASFNVLKQEYDGHLPSVHFENRSMAGRDYQWNFGDGETSTIAHPDHIYKKKGVYNVELTVTNDIGCVDQTMKEVHIENDYNLDAPASFSPNGDGSDETFIPVALRTLGVKFHLAIYDTNGGLMYETSDATLPWTGRPNNQSAICAAGDYVWVVDVREGLHLAETYTGKVKLTK